MFKISNTKPLPMNQEMNIGGLVITLKSAIRNKTYYCNNCYGCPTTELSLKPTNSEVVACEFILNIRNTLEKGWRFYRDQWEMVDTDAYSYSSGFLCDNLKPLRIIFPDYYTLKPRTQVDVILVFPELGRNKEIAKLLYTVSDADPEKTFHIDINPLKSEAQKLFEDTRVTYSNFLVDKETIENVRSNIQRLKTVIYSRLNNKLIDKEITKFENEIKRRSFEVHSLLQPLDDINRKIYQQQYQTIIDDYNNEVTKRREEESRQKLLIEKVEELHRISPREFEIYIGELFSELGYEKVEVTSFSNDKGVDVLIEHKGEIIVVQCKRFKGVIGSPYIQSFIGAIHHAKADRGIFVTTSVFSFEAIKMASQHPIELVDGAKLAQLIRKVYELHNLSIK